MALRSPLTALVVLAACAWPLASSAQPGAGPASGPFGMRSAMRGLGGDMLAGDAAGMMLPLMLHHADLTPDQQKRVQDILAADREQLHALFQQLEAANDALAAKLLASGAIDAAALQPDVERVTHFRQQLMEQGIKTVLAVRAVLTPEQLAKTAALQGKLHALQQQMHELLEAK